MNLRYWSYNLPFIYPFTISRGTKTHQPSLVVELEHRGLKGYGEAPAITYYNIPVEQMIADLELKKTFIEKFALTDPERFWHYLHHLIPENNFLVCALDMAAWDLYGKMRGLPLYKLWGLDMKDAPLTDYTIGIDTLGNMLDKMEKNPWPVYKIKLGTPEDIRIITAIREKTKARIRVDANAGWTLEETLKLIVLLKDLNVEFIEQPLAKDNWEGMKTLYGQSILPLIADESCVTENDVSKCAGHFHGINIKLTKCSGITPARRMISAARELGLQVMIGSMNETTIGSAAIAHLLPAVDHADADGPLLLAKDIATGLTYSKGKVMVSDEPGLGIQFHPPR
jgi:L-alanine-DL-glutamate epimerase-like enolase superfamily enzyme